MIRSLTIKLIMLAGTLGFLFALHWGGADRGAETTLPSDESIGSSTRTVVSTSGKSLDNSVNNDFFPKQQPSSGSKQSDSKRNAIDLNVGTAQELQALPGIGPILAQRIVDRRKQVGGFQSIQELDQVKGIGTKKLQKLSPFIKISPQKGTPQQQS